MMKAKSDRDRSAIMRAVKSRDTSPELATRRLLYSIAAGYRLHRKDIPGNPDISYIRFKKAIFVHGCFWHGHHCNRGARIPKTNRRYWVEKIERNRARDRRSRAALKRIGWSSIVVWECELRSLDKVASRLRRFVTVS